MRLLGNTEIRLMVGMVKNSVAYFIIIQ